MCLNSARKSLPEYEEAKRALIDWCLKQPERDMRIRTEKVEKALQAAFDRVALMINNRYDFPTTTVVEAAAYAALLDAEKDLFNRDQLKAAAHTVTRRVALVYPKLKKE